LKIKICLLAVIFLALSGIFVFAALDLKFNNTINMEPASPSAGATVTFSVMFQPSGAAVDNLKCTWGIDSTTIDQKTFGHLNAGATTGLIFEWTATSGNHTVWFELDPDHAQNDSDYSNNRIEKQITVAGGSSSGPNLPPVSELQANGLNAQKKDINKPGVVMIPPKPNLIIQSVDFPSGVADGVPVAYSVVVKNAGAVSSSSAAVLKFLVSGNEIQNHTVPVLSSGETFTVNGNWTAACASACNSKPSFKIDFYNAVDESKEDDNTWEGSYFCSCHQSGPTHTTPNYSDMTEKIHKPGYNNQGQNKPNLQIEVTYTPSVPSTLTCDGRVNFTIKIKNVGNAATGKAFKFYKYYRDDLVYFGYCDPLGPGEEYVAVQNAQLIVCNSQCISLWKFVVDPENVIAESNENDNLFALSLNCACQ
jgi:subtilase family serine protease